MTRYAVLGDGGQFVWREAAPNGKVKILGLRQAPLPSWVNPLLSMTEESKRAVDKAVEKSFRETEREDPTIVNRGGKSNTITRWKEEPTARNCCPGAPPKRSGVPIPGMDDGSER